MNIIPSFRWHKKGKSQPFTYSKSKVCATNTRENKDKKYNTQKMLASDNQSSFKEYMTTK